MKHYPLSSEFFKIPFHRGQLCQKVLQIADMFNLGVSKTFLQTKIFGSSSHDKHHHALDRCIKYLVEGGYLINTGKVVPLFWTVSEYDEGEHFLTSNEIFYVLDRTRILENIRDEELWDGLADSDEVASIELSRPTEFEYRDFLKSKPFKCKICGTMNKFVEKLEVEKPEYNFFWRLQYKCKNCGYSYSHDFVPLSNL